MNRILLIFILIPCVTFSQIFQSNIGYKIDTSKWSINGVNIYNKNQGGNVGINTTTPIYRLDVKGASYFNDSIMLTKIQNANNVEAYNICHYSLGSTITGAMHITTNIVAGSNTMIDFDIDAYNYSSDGAWSGKIGLYSYGTPSILWLNTGAVGCRNLPVKAYANTSGKVVIVIGDSLQTWSYPRISITRARLSHVGAQDSSLKNWSISIINLAVNTTNYPTLSALFGGGITPNYRLGLPVVSNLDAIQPTGGFEINNASSQIGVGIGSNGIYLSGTTYNKNFYFRTGGNGSYYFQFPKTTGGSTFKRLNDTARNNQVMYERYMFGAPSSLEWFRINYQIQDTSTTFRKSQIVWNMRFGNNIFGSPMSLEANRVDSTMYPFLFMGNRMQNRRIVLYDVSTVSDHQFYGFGVNPGTLRYQVAASAYHRFCVATSATKSDTIVSIGNKSLGINKNTPIANFDLNGSYAQSYRVITATTTLAATDGIVYVNNGATNITITLPLTDSKIFEIVRYNNTSTGTITIQLSGGTIQAEGGTIGATTSISATAGQRSVRFQVTGTIARRLTNN